MVSVLHQWIPAFAGMTRLSLCFGFCRDDAHPRHKTRGAVDINNANAYDSRLMGWMNRFRDANSPVWLGYLDVAQRIDARLFLETALASSKKTSVSRSNRS